jgi:parallel beta-helix repeat protein
MCLASVRNVFRPFRGYKEEMMQRTTTKANLCTIVGAVLLFSLLSATRLSAQSITYYVNAASGNDENNCVQARNPGTPLRTITKAINGCILDGDTVIVKEGLYNETVDLKRNFVTLRAEPRRGATIQPPAGQGVLVDSLAGITVEGFIVQGGTTGISFIRADNSIARDNVVHSNTVHGIAFSDTTGGMAEKNIVHTNTQMGIRYLGGADGVVRNNLVFNNDDWGISLEPTATSVANVIESNTVDGNVNGVRLLSGGGSIRNNIITNNGARGLHFTNTTQVQEDYNDIIGHTTKDFDYSKTPGLNTISVDPKYVGPVGTENGYHLSQLAAGQSVDSPCVNAGSGPVEGSSTEGSTATDNFPDEEDLDLGFHYQIFRSTFQTFSIANVSTSIAYSGGQLKASYTINGTFTLGSDSDGINPVSERVRVEVDTYGETLPLGSCTRPAAGSYSCTASSPGVTSLKIKFTSSTGGTFDLIVKLVPAPPTPLPLNVRLRLFVGADIGVAEKVYVRGTLLAP